MAIQPGPSEQQRASGGGDTAQLSLRPARRRGRSLLAALLAVVGLCGFLLAGAGIRGQLKPRTFTPAQQKRIEAWEVAKRWRTTSKAQLFPSVIGYELTSSSSGSKAGLKLKARRLEIAPQASCVKAAGGSRSLMAMLNGDGCLALLRSTYADASSSLVLTAGIAVLKNQASAAAAARYLTGGPAFGQGGPARQLVLSPFRVSGTPAALFGYPQRQLSWIVAAGPYLVMATVGYADGRPRVPVRTDSYVLQEMNSLARGVAIAVAAPLGAPPPVPRCPGAPSC
ncbi:MAG TPA: hypothetical protein VMU94_04705 [Streptosporangiaceae bacterium]|nr:hypothetical protein [Streptosporangiaceae bacterium]